VSECSVCLHTAVVTHGHCNIITETAARIINNKIGYFVVQSSFLTYEWKLTDIV